MPATQLVRGIIFFLVPGPAVDPRILAICGRITAKRAKTVIDHILQHGFVTTEDLRTKHGYHHPPRAVRDVREKGVPIETFWITSEQTGRKIGAYRFGDPAKIRHGRIGGRKIFSKEFKEQLLNHYDARDAITGERMAARYLQIDHRVPYEVAGDQYAQQSTPVDEYMLLDASSQRAKSWSCENCSNWKETRSEAVCRSCFWAFPESYTHIAGEQVRRVVVEWRGTAIEGFERLEAHAQREGVTVAALLKRLSEG